MGYKIHKIQARLWRGAIFIYIFLFVSILIWTFLPAKINYAIAQGIELACPSPTTSLGGPFDIHSPNNGRIRQYFCIDQNGILTIRITDAGGQVLNIKAYGAIGDAQSVNDGVATAGANATVTSATANWQTTAKVGQFIYCNQFSSSSATVNIPVGSKITSITSNTVIQTNGAGSAQSGLRCVWYTQDDTSAIVATVTAAKALSTTRDTNSGPWLNPTAKTVYLPEGGYVVTSRIYSLGSPGNSNPCPNFIGSQEDHTQIFVAPGLPDPNDGGGVLFEGVQCFGGEIGHFTIDGGGYIFNYFHNLFRCFSCNSVLLNKLRIINIGTSGTALAALSVQVSNNVTIRDSVVENAPGGTTDFALDTTSANNILIEAGLYGNHNGGTLISASNPSRSTNGGPIMIVNAVLDECSPPVNTFCIDLTGAGAQVIFQGVTMYGGLAGAMSVGSTSQAWLTNVNCGIFGTTAAAASCMTLASGANVYVSGSTLRSNGSATILNGPSGANFISVGANQWQNCVNSVCSAVTAATYATLGVSGGMVPKSTETHSPNTCYAVTGNLLATAQNICFILLDQNYQLLNMTAQSGGTTPANSACATPPIITLTDGTRTATMTMTSGKTQWTSTVDSVTNINQIFANAATLTISIGANTCATPPANVSVNYVLQSILNP